MKIALYAHNLHQSGGLSVGRSITAVLPKIAPKHEYLITVPKDRGYDALKELPNVEVWELPLGSYRARLAFERRVAGYLRKRRFDWAWVLGNNLIYLPSCPISTLLHSPYYLGYPYAEWGIDGCLTGFKNRFTTFCVKRTIRRSRFVYGQTRTVCRRIVESFGIPSSRVRQCAMGNALENFADESNVDPEAAKTMRRFDGKFKLFYPSACYKHKNQRRIVETFARYRDELKDVVCFLTFDAGFSANARVLTEAVKKNGLEENVVFLGTIPHSQIAACYRAADACFYPTFLETVGLGHLEAMAFGLPVIASDLDFAREVCGDAALFVDPFSLESMRDGVLKLKNDKNLQNDLRERGARLLRNAQKSWEENLALVLDNEGVERL